MGPALLWAGVAGTRNDFVDVKWHPARTKKTRHLHAWSGSNIYLIRSSPSTTTGSSKNILRALSFNFSETCPPSRASMVSNAFLSMNGRTSAWRSEERRVGKEQMHGWTVDHGNK